MFKISCQPIDHVGYVIAPHHAPGQVCIGLKVSEKKMDKRYQQDRDALLG
jgi:hypothetical protein